MDYFSYLRSRISKYSTKSIFPMRNFRRVDNLLGWLVFAIAAFVYCSTVEPTASFWDCPEFITTGYKLEVGHPPGAPFFMLTANLFSQFASDPSTVAYMVNIMNALLSALCIMFLFWSITHLARRLVIDDWSELTTAKLISIEASGLVGALIYTFSDTFWYSAVEGEVYAYSSLFTAIVFWLILKWEDHADEPHADRWLVLIAYMTGLSIGVHLLNLLCIPALVLVYYYKRFPDANLKGSILALIISAILIAAVLYGVVPGIITVGGWFELLFVNTLGMPFNTGVLVYILLLVAVVIWAIYESYVDRSECRQNISFVAGIALLGIPFYGYGWSAAFIGIVALTILWFVLKIKRKGMALVTARAKNTIMLCLLMLMIGYSTYAVIVIRSSANPPMDQNSPEDIFTLGNYLSRDQYGYRPLLYGQAYNSEYAATPDGRVKMQGGAPVYQRKEKASPDEPDSYFIVSRKENPEYVQNMFFPRMYSAAHKAAYESWMGGVEGKYEPSAYSSGEMVKMPTMVENLKFFFTYQVNFMYWRYFMWNFAGRQNDIQGHGEITHGNWISGIPFLDNARLGDQELLPDELKENKGHNVFYCLPLLLGLIGLFWQAFRGVKGIRQFWVVFFLFFMTGLAIVLYLNQTPQQPRERDYAYAGSFYAYAIWCGLGVVAIIEMLKNLLKRESVVTSAIIGVAALAVPVQMASQTWDDHDRSGRYTCRDFGWNYLQSLQSEGKPIIFTNGDNDTFPLWYGQETEGFRTDARVCNLSYLQTDWYIDQMRRPAYDSPSVPITWPRIDYCAGTSEYVTIQPDLKEGIRALYKEHPDEAKKLFGDEPFELKNVLKLWVRGDMSANTSAYLHSLFEIPENERVQVIPTDTLYMTIDKDAVRRSGMMLPSDTIPDRMVISLKGRRSLGKSDLMMLEMVSQCNWTRPLYVAITVGEENFINLGDNFIQEGLVNRITPFTTRGGKTFDADKTYDVMMNKFKYGGVSDPNVYLDQTVYRMCCTHKRLFGQLANALIDEGKTDKARKALEKMEKELPESSIHHDYLSGSLDQIRAWGKLGEKAKAAYIAGKMWKSAEQYLNFYMSLDTMDFLAYQDECLMNIQLMSYVIDAMKPFDEEWAEKHFEKLQSAAERYQSKGGQIPGMQ